MTSCPPIPVPGGLWKAIATDWELSERLCPPRLPPGVFKHRTIEDANRQTEAWEAEGVRRQKARTAPSTRGAPR